MKNKTFNKKLLLNKSTVADLGLGEMNEVKGGLTYTCPTGMTICITVCFSICPTCMETDRTCPCLT